MLQDAKTIVNPIIDWLVEDVWEFLDDVAKVPHCCLYDQGYTRLGCIGCPMSYNRERELESYPKYKAAYLRAFGRMIEERERRGKETTFETPLDVMNWYMEKKPAVEEPVLDGQMDISEVEHDEHYGHV